MKTVVLWIVRVLLCAAFLGAAFGKLSGNPMMVATFDKIGIGQWFRYLTGGLEVVGALLIVVPAVSVFGALLLTCIMVGAICTHLFVIGGSPAAAIVLLVLSLLAVWLQRERLNFLGRG